MRTLSSNSLSSVLEVSTLPGPVGARHRLVLPLELGCDGARLARVFTEAIVRVVGPSEGGDATHDRMETRVDENGDRIVELRTRAAGFSARVLAGVVGPTLEAAVIDKLDRSCDEADRASLCVDVSMTQDGEQGSVLRLVFRAHPVADALPKLELPQTRGPASTPVSLPPTRRASGTHVRDSAPGDMDAALAFAAGSDGTTK